MKIIIQSIIYLGFSAGLFSQQDPEAKVILDKAAEKTKAYASLQAGYTLNIDDRKENTSTSDEGNILIKGNKYRLESKDNTVYFDGKTMWTYAKDLNEVTITEPDMEDEDFLGNPAKILLWYNRDFKYRYVQETTFKGKPVHEIDLFPKNLDQPYSRIKIYLGTDNLLLYSLKTIGKDGIDYAVELHDYIIDKDLADELFVFEPAKHKKVEVFDMRF